MAPRHRRSHRRAAGLRRVRRGKGFFGNLAQAALPLAKNLIADHAVPALANLAVSKLRGGRLRRRRTHRR